MSSNNNNNNDDRHEHRRQVDDTAEVTDIIMNAVKGIKATIVFGALLSAFAQGAVNQLEHIYQKGGGRKGVEHYRGL